VEAAGIACIDNLAGGMGIHDVNVDLLLDPALDPATPEVLVYEPDKPRTVNPPVRRLNVTVTRPTPPQPRTDTDPTHKRSCQRFPPDRSRREIDMNITARTTRHTRTAVAAVAAGALTCLTLGLSGSTATAEDAGRVDIGYAKHGDIEFPPPLDVGYAKHGGVEAPEPVDIGRLLNGIDTPVGNVCSLGAE